MKEDDDIGYAVPKEGSVVWMDNMAIPVGAPHPENAHAFINYILDAKVGADIANFIHYASPNAAARKHILPQDLNNPAIYPPPSAIAASEVIVDVGDKARLYDEAWVAIQAGRSGMSSIFTLRAWLVDPCAAIFSLRSKKTTTSD